MGDQSTGSWRPINTASLSGSGQSDARQVAPYREANFYFRTTSVGSNLDFTIQMSPDNTNWFTLATQAQITATGNTGTRISSNLGEYVRLDYSATGTFGIVVDAVFKT